MILPTLDKRAIKMGKLSVIFNMIDEGKVNLKTGSLIAGYSYCHFTRLYKRYLEKGLEGLYKERRERRWRKLSPKYRDLLVKEFKWYDEEPPLSVFLYFLGLDHPDFPDISTEWIRKTLISEGVWKIGKRRTKFRARFEMPQPGMLVQGDETSIEVPYCKDRKHLVCFIDDNTRLCLVGKILEHDTVKEHFLLHKEIIKRYGIYQRLYYDNDEKYSWIRHKDSRHFTYRKEEGDLQVVRALKELGIEVTNSTPFEPQGKGKIERYFGTLKKQIPFWFKRYRIRTIEEANEVLRKWIEYYNNRVHREIGCTPLERMEENKYGVFKNPGLRRADIDTIFSYRYYRKVNKDNTLKFNGDVYQLRSGFKYRSYSGKKAELRHIPDKFLRVFVDGKLVQLFNLNNNKSVLGKVAVL